MRSQISSSSAQLPTSNRFRATRFFRLCSVLVLALCTTRAEARQLAGASDPTFNPADNGASGDNSGLNDTVYAVALQPDGKLLVGGTFQSVNGTSRSRIARLNADGSLDLTFNPGLGFGGTTTTFGVVSLAVQPDGKVVVGGSNIATYDGVAASNLLRLNADGTRDASFAASSTPNGPVTEISVQADGKLLVAGGFTLVGATGRNRIARLLSDGTIDGSFIYGTGANNTISALTLQPDGKILLGGTFTSFDGSIVNRIVRLNANGGIDTGFLAGTGLGANSGVESLAVQADGRVLASGAFTTWNGVARSRLARLNADGTLDGAYNPGASEAAISMVVQPDAKLIAVGRFTSIAGVTQSRIARLHVDGSLDTSFSVGLGASGLVHAATLQGDGKLIIGGDHATYRGNAPAFLTRIESNGATDTTFGLPAGANGTVQAIALQPDGKALIGGSFTSYGGQPCTRIARIMPDGTVDASFQTGAGAYGGVIAPIVSALAVQADGKAVVGGDFNRFNGVVANRLARLNSDGSVDTAFATAIGTAVGSLISCIVIQPDGKLLVGGNFPSFNGFSIGRIVRLNPDGSRDLSFVPGTAANAAVRCVALQADGKILIGGEFTTFSGVPAPRIARLNADGTLDTSFVSGVGPAGGLPTTFVSAIAVQPDGKLVLGGQFTTYNGTISNHIAQLNTDGSLSMSFGVASFSINNAVLCLALQPDGKIVAGGLFNSVQANNRPFLARFTTNGTLDASFGSDTGLNNEVRCMQLQPDGKALIGGTFLSFSGTTRSRLARVYCNAGQEFSMGSFCVGDGSGSVCPCGNAGSADAGCANSINPSGASLVGSGIPSLSADTLLLTASGMPNSAGLYFQSSFPAASGAGVPFGDGLLCLASPITRLGAKMNVAGSSSYPASSDLSVSLRGGITSPGTVRYQVWYRNAASYCSDSTFNLTNGLRVLWTP